MKQNNILRQVGHSLSLFLGHCLAFFPQLWFDVRLKYYTIRYGGGDKIPPAILKKLMGGDNMMKETVKTMKVTTALQDLGGKLGVDFVSADYKFTCALSLYMRGELQDVDMHERIMAMREMNKGVRRAVLNELLSLGDVKQHKLDFLFTGENKVLFEEWLNEK